MQNTPCPIGDYIDYITNPDNIWNPEKYLNSRRISGVTGEGTELQFTYSYVLGNSYMVGNIGKGFSTKVEVFYRDLQGFQVKIDLGNGCIYEEGFVPYKKEKAKELILHYANL